MKRSDAELIGKKARALKHCVKILELVDKRGSTEILLNNTGITIPCKKGDAMYTLLQSIKYALAHEINDIQVVSMAHAKMLPAPTGACDDTKTEHTCAVCGRAITKMSNAQKYCAECAHKAELARKREYSHRTRLKKAAQTS